MRNFLQNMAYSLQRMMQGRYGVDEFSKFLDISGLVFFVLSLLKPLRFLYFIAVILIVWSLLRSYSKNLTKRYAELNKYLKIKNKIIPEIQIIKNRILGRKTHKYFKCSGCKTQLKVPKGKGKIEISCPKCKMVMVKKT